MDRIVRGIAKLSVALAIVTASSGSMTARAIDSGESKPAPIIRRTPPVDAIRRLPSVEVTIRRVPPVAEEENDRGAGNHEDALAGIRRLPAVTEQLEPETTGSSWTAEMRRLPDVQDELQDSNRPQIAASYLGRWQAASDPLIPIAQQARVAIEKGYRLAEKGALYSARAEFIEALRGTALGLDAHYGDEAHMVALLAAVRALHEADDFAPGDRHLEAHLDVARITAAHRTRLPGEMSDKKVSGLLAMQRYYAFAQDRLAAATGGSPVAAEALYGLGKVYMALAEKQSSTEKMPGPKSMVYLGSSLLVNPTHARAANELGVQYARLGKYNDARRILEQSVASSPQPENWQNLAIIHDRMGDSELAQRAVQEYRRLVANATPTNNGPVQWVDVATFNRGRTSSSANSSPGVRPPRTASRPAHLW